MRPSWARLGERLRALRPSPLAAGSEGPLAPREREGASPTGALTWPGPYHHRVIARFFPVRVDAAVLARAVPEPLEVAQGLAETALVGVMRYPEAWAAGDPRGARTSFREVLVAAFVRERAAPLELGLFFLTLFVDDDVALTIGREVYGFPKKLARIELSDERVRVERPGLLEGEQGALARPLVVLEGTFGSRAPSRLERAADALDGWLLGARGVARSTRRLVELAFYNEQRALAPPGSGERRQRRLLRAPVRELTIERVTPLGGAELTLARAATDPLFRLAPRGDARLVATRGLEVAATFVLDDARLVDEAPLEPTRAPGPPPAGGERRRGEAPHE